MIKNLLDTFDNYIYQLQELSCNPKFENMDEENWNQHYNNLISNTLKAFLENEDDTAEALSDIVILSYLSEYLPTIQEHFKSKKIADVINETYIKETLNSKTTWTKSMFDKVAEDIKKANKIFKREHYELYDHNKYI